MDAKVKTRRRFRRRAGSHTQRKRSRSRSRSRSRLRRRRQRGGMGPLGPLMATGLAAALVTVTAVAAVAATRKVYKSFSQDDGIIQWQQHEERAKVVSEKAVVPAATETEASAEEEEEVEEEEVEVEGEEGEEGEWEQQQQQQQQQQLQQQYGEFYLGVNVIDERERSPHALKPCGMENIGNGCYKNSFLQVLRRMTTLNNALRAIAHEATNPEDEFLNAYLQVVDKANRLDFSVNNPCIPSNNEFDNELNKFGKDKFDDWKNVYNTQQDASEFFQFLIARFNDNTIIKKIINIDRITKKQNKHNGSNVYEPKTEQNDKIILEFDENMLECFPCTESNLKKIKSACMHNTSVTKLEDMLLKKVTTRHDFDHYIMGIHIGILDEIESFSIPDENSYLFIHFNRFKFTQNKETMEIKTQKCMNRIKVPLMLDMAPIVAADDAEENPDRARGPSDIPLVDNASEDKVYQYDLLGAIVHLGDKPSTGHYTSIVKAKDDNYYYFSDEIVNKCDNIHDVLNAVRFQRCVYYLIYERIPVSK